MLHDLLSGGKLSAFGLDDEGAFAEISRTRLSKPYFDIDVLGSLFQWAPDEWAPIFVSKAILKRYLAEIANMKPRKTIKHNWQKVTSTAWKIALEEPLLREPNRLIGAVQQAFIDEDEKDPGDKELRDLVNEIIAFLGDRTLSREVSGGETSSDTQRDSV